MKIKSLFYSAAMMAVFISPQLAADQVEAGRTVADVHCQACHGANGISSAPTWPNLAGQKQQYLIKQLNDFASGKRPDPVMAPIVDRLSEEDIAAVAAYYSSL